MYSASGDRDKMLTNPFRVFSLQEIQSATKDFNEELVIGEGGFGKVYKGEISSEEGGYVVAIKRLDSQSSQGELEFRAEIETLCSLRHCHLVSLVGYCDEKHERVLVYEYMSNGTLYHHLHKAETPLNWVQRIKIAVGAARGLDYLHTGVGTHHGIIHRDVKSSNILLDENMEALISDFGLSKIGPTNQPVSYVDASVKGTFGYMDPEYFYTRRLTRKTDVFAFGVVLFEMISGRLPVDLQYGEDQCSLVRWAKKCVKERKLDQMVDSNIRGKIFPKCLRRFTQIAYDCLLSDPKERPIMADVVASLSALLELQQKHDNSVNSLGAMGFTWKIHKYLTLKTKQNSDQSTSSSTNNDGDDINGEIPRQHDGDHGEMPHQHGELVPKDLKTFTYDELKCASRDFQRDMFLGEGEYVAVYKGWVDKMTYSPCVNDTGLPIVINRLNRFKLRRPDMLKDFCHPNLVKPIGYCLEGEQQFLVYEFMSKGKLSNLLWDDAGAKEVLPLVTKVKIVVGIARAIVFLNKKKVRFGDLYGIGSAVSETELRIDNMLLDQWVGKSQLHISNILLDESFTAKVSDYVIPANIDFYWNITDYPLGFKPIRSECNLVGFRALFANVVTGTDMFTVKELEKIITKWSLEGVADQCFQICNEENAESEMLKILEKIMKNNNT